MDNRKLIVAFYIAASGILWYLTRSSLKFLHLTFYQIRRMPGNQYIVEGVPFLVAGILFIVLMKHPRVNLLLDEVVAELRKVSWPSREDVVRSTIVVIVCIGIASFILAGFDLLWGKVFTYLLKV